MKERGSSLNWNSTQPEKQFLKRLRARRQLLGFTQAEATKLLPKPAPKYWWIGRVENGEVKITTKRLIQMSYLEWKLNQELNHRKTFNKDEEFFKEYQEYIKNEYRKRPATRD